MESTLEIRRLLRLGVEAGVCLFDCLVFWGEGKKREGRVPLGLFLATCSGLVEKGAMTLPLWRKFFFGTLISLASSSAHLVLTVLTLRFNGS